jgi:hypothetical protein
VSDVPFTLSVQQCPGWVNRGVRRVPAARGPLGVAGPSQQPIDEGPDRAGRLCSPCPGGDRLGRRGCEGWDRVRANVKSRQRRTKEVRVEEQSTCGMGLAEHAVLPAKLGELAASVAENLEVHVKALDLQDRNAEREHVAYVSLAKQHREIAAQLEAMANEMAGYRELPMGKHDEKAMSEPRVLEAFERFVKVKQELLVLLQKQAEQDQSMLVAMRGEK